MTITSNELMPGIIGSGSVIFQLWRLAFFLFFWGGGRGSFRDYFGLASDFLRRRVYGYTEELGLTSGAYFFLRSCEEDNRDVVY